MKKVLCVLAAATAGLSLYEPAVVAAESTAVLEEVVVTARRIAENLQVVPIAVTALSAEAIKNRQIDNARDIQFSVPNLLVKPSNTGPTIPEFILRGQRQVLFSDPNVVVYVNGVPQGARGLTFYDLQSIQAVKGPQGTLFGKTAVGGAMLFTTKQPVFETEAELELKAGNFSYGSATGMFNVPLGEKAALRVSGEIETRDGVFKNSYPGGDDLADRDAQSIRALLLVQPTDKLESTFQADYLDRDELPTPSIIEASGLAAPGFGGLISLLGQQAVALQSQLGGAEAVVNTAKNQLERRGNPFRVSMPTGQNATLPLGFKDLPAGLYTKTEIWGVQNTTTYEINENFSIKNILGYRDTEAYDHVNPSGEPGLTLNLSQFLTFLGVPGLPEEFPGMLINNNSLQYESQETWTEEIQFIGNTENLEFIVGGFYSNDEYLYSSVTSFAVGFIDFLPAAPKYQNTKIKTDSYAIYAQGTYDLAGIGLDRWRLTLGGRYNWDDRDYDATNFFANNDKRNPNGWANHVDGAICNEIEGVGRVATGINNGTDCALVATRNYDEPTWTVSVDYQATDDTMIYLTARRGYKSGRIAATVNTDLAVYEPETLTDIELGVKHQGTLGSVPYRLNIAGFTGKYEDIQTQAVLNFCVDQNDCPPGAPNYTELLIFNVGKATIQGIELDASMFLLPNLSLDFTYAYQDTEYKGGSVLPEAENPGPIWTGNPIDFEGGNSLEGDSFTGVPKQQFTVAATLDLGEYVPASIASPVLSVNYAWSGKQEGAALQGIDSIPSYGFANALLALNELAGSRMSLSFWVKNLTDEEYKLRCINNQGSIGYSSCTWGDPRTYGVTLSAAF